jgi:glycosyltransferase involved in cell wall biosynthesis
VKQLVIVQPYVPTYRVPFFEGLVNELRENGIQCRVLAGQPTGTQKHRNDAAAADWIVEIPYREISLWGRSLKLGGAGHHVDGADAVIVGHIGTSWDANRAVLNGSMGGTPVGLWGHIKSYVNHANPLDAAVERWQLRNAHHVFAYTPGGAAYAQQCGVPKTSLTTVMNTVPTDQLMAARNSLTLAEVSDFRAQHGLLDRPVLAYVGALDQSKKVDLLASALDVLWSEDPSVRVLVAGRGVLEGLLDTAVERGQAILLGYADADTKARMAAVSRALLNPGRIGLVAVDALVLGRPILTTRYPFHAPEVEYLREGESMFVSDMNPDAFAHLALRAAHGRDVQSHWAFPTMPNMVENFARGCLALLSNRGMSDPTATSLQIRRPHWLLKDQLQRRTGDKDRPGSSKLCQADGERSPWVSRD